MSINPASGRSLSRALCASTCSLILALAACGGSSGSGSTPPCTTCNSPSSDFVYEATASQISTFQVDSTTGAIISTPSPVTTLMTPGGMISTSNNFLYLTDSSGRFLFGYSVDPSTGALTEIPGSPFDSGAMGVTSAPCGLAADPEGKYLYVALPDSDTVRAFVIATDGSLSSVPMGQYNSFGYPSAATVDSQGKFLFVSNNVLASISAFSIDSATGALSNVPGSPFPSVPAGGPLGLATDPKGNYLYVPLFDLNLISSYVFDASGTLSSIGTPWTVGSQPMSVVTDPLGKFVFSADTADISVFSIGSSDGALSPVNGSPYGVAYGAKTMSVNESGSLLFSVSGLSPGVRVFSISSSGQLSSLNSLDPNGSAIGVAVVHKQ